MIKSYKIFFTPTCPKCPMVKQFMKEESGLIGAEVDASTEDGLEEAIKFGVNAVPIVVFFSADGKERGRAASVEEIKRILENKSLSEIGKD